MPGVQNPHCSPWQATKPCCTGSSVAPFASPSTVRTRWPSAITASTVQDFTGTSSSQTVQTPQLDVSQPQWVPVRPRSSRRKWTSRVRLLTSRSWSVPLTLTVMRMSGPRSLGAGHRAAQRPRGQLTGQMSLVVDRPALVGVGCAVGAGQPAGFGEVLLGRRPATQEVLGLPGVEVRGPDRGQPDPDVAD